MLKWFKELNGEVQWLVILAFSFIFLAVAQGVHDTVNHYLDLKYKSQIVYVKSEDTSQQVANSNTGS